MSACAVERQHGAVAQGASADQPALASEQSGECAVERRIGVFDEADRVLESDDQDTGAPDGGLAYRIQLHDPLLAGHRYALVIDPQTPGVVRDATGRDLDELRWDLRVEGEREKPPVRPAGKRHRRH